MKKNTIKLNESQIRKIVAESARRVLKEQQEANYSVFYKDGDEANDSYLTKEQAMSLAMRIEDDGYEVIVAKLLPNNEWDVIYETH